MRRSHGWTLVQWILASDWAIAGFKGMHDPLRVYQCLSRYLKNGKFSSREMRDFLPELLKYLSRDCKRRGIIPPKVPSALLKKIGEKYEVQSRRN